MNNRQTGNVYENVAEQYLIRQGYEILERNYTVRTGEVDRIAREGEYLCFVEVKYRSTDRYGSPEEAVSFAKQRSISRVAQIYMTRNHLSEWTPVRFDVVCVYGAGNETRIELIRNAFEFHV